MGFTGRSQVSNIEKSTCKQCEHLNKFGHDPRMSIQAATRRQVQGGGGASRVPLPLSVVI
jgi:hypothetical protein